MIVYPPEAVERINRVNTKNPTISSYLRIRLSSDEQNQKHS